jgi:hypothetical protein
MQPPFPIRHVAPLLHLTHPPLLPLPKRTQIPPTHEVLHVPLLSPPPQNPHTNIVVQTLERHIREYTVPSPISLCLVVDVVDEASERGEEGRAERRGHAGDADILDYTCGRCVARKVEEAGGEAVVGEVEVGCCSWLYAREEFGHGGGGEVSCVEVLVCVI